MSRAMVQIVNTLGSCGSAEGTEQLTFMDDNVCGTDMQTVDKVSV